MSKEQKQESLKRRSHEHFKKEIAPERAAKLAAVRAEGKAMMKNSRAYEKDGRGSNVSPGVQIPNRSGE